MVAASSDELDIDQNQESSLNTNFLTENVIDWPQLWNSVLNQLKTEVSAPVFSAYFGTLEFSSYDSEANLVTISAPSSLIRNHIDDSYGHRMQELLKEASQKDISISFEIRALEKLAAHTPYVVVKRVQSNENVSAPHTHQVQIDSKNEGISLIKSEPIVSNINPKYTFSNFIVGNSNQFCHAASLQVAEKPGVSYNPLFIYGGVGLGKTHLLHAIGNKILEEKPDAKILYMSSEGFTNDLIQALRNSKMDEFKQKMRSIEVLLIDDIQFMVGKERTQEEFFHTFNALYGAKHQIVITSDKIPSEIPQIEERLYTRFSWGLIADIQSPDFETRVAILKKKAMIDGFELPEDVGRLIADKISSNVRELEGALTRIHAISSLQGIPLTEELAISSLKYLFQPKKINLTVDDIKKAVASHFSLKVSDIISKRRTKNLSFPRHIAMYLCRKHTTCSYPEIGAHFGGRDHSSVIHAASVVTTKIKNDSSVRQQVGEIEKFLLHS